MAPPDATDVLSERLDALLAEETTTAVAKPAPALLLEADDDAPRLWDRDRAAAPGALEEVGISASTASMAPVTLAGSTWVARAFPAPRAGTALGIEGCEDDACIPDAFA